MTADEFTATLTDHLHPWLWLFPAAVVVVAVVATALVMVGSRRP